MTTAKKILFAFAFALLAIAAVGGVAYWSTKAMGDRLTNVTDVKLPTVNAVWTCSSGLADMGRNVTALMLRRGDGAFRAKALGLANGASARIDEGIRAYEALPHSDAALAHWRDAMGKLREWREQAKTVIDLTLERDRLLSAGMDRDSPSVTELDGRCWTEFLRVRALHAPASDALEGTVRQAMADAEAARDEGAVAARRGLASILVVLVVSAALLAALGVFLGRKIGGTISTLAAEAATLTEAVARGQLDLRGDATRVDAEFRPIITGINQTMDAFAKPIQVTTRYLTRISKGDLPEKIADRYEGDFDQIKQSLNTCIDTLEALDADAVTLAGAAVQGHLAVRADAQRHQGAFRRIVEGVNGTIDTLVGHLDAIPSPAMIVGADHKVRYLNPAGLRMVGRSRDEAIGVQCSTLFKSGNCGTGSCVCARAMQENRAASSETIAHPDGKSVDIAHAGVPLRDAGGKIIGAFEVFNDQTAVQEAVRHSKKVADFQAKETDRIVAALEGFSRGELELDASVGAGDADTAQVRAVYETIAKAIVRSAEAVRALARDAGSLADAAVAGKLSTRADASRHQGDFRKIVDGVNRTLDAVLAPVNEATLVLERLAARDLRARVQGSYLGDHARITESVNATGQALHDALAQVASAVDQVSSAATQIAASSQAVASGASEQASSLEETSTTIESVAAMTRSAADNAQQANTLAQSARSAATEGAAAVEQMQGAMGKIRHSAESTSQIIKDVSDIAFQTNLLALNAAVEAARAGEAGRGFAVVAEEVRSLALRAKEAATKTEELIRQSVKQTGEGEVAARHVAEKLGEILGGVGKVTDIVAEIAAAAKEQTAGIGQVNEAVGEMDKVTQQNAASAEESSSAASELSGQAEQLAAMVGAFQLERDQRAVTPAATKVLPPRPLAAGGANARANGKQGRAALPSAAVLAGGDLKDF